MVGWEEGRNKAKKPLCRPEKKNVPEWKLGLCQHGEEEEKEGGGVECSSSLLSC